MRLLGTVAERVQKLKAAGVPEQEVVARAPSAEFDAKWGSTTITPAAFVANVYNTV